MAKEKAKPVKLQINKLIKFTGSRITKGNPVTGILLKEDKNSIFIRLTKDIEGMVNIWYEGEERSFTKDLIHSISQ